MSHFEDEEPEPVPYPSDEELARAFTQYQQEHPE